MFFPVRFSRSPNDMLLFSHTACFCFFLLRLLFAWIRNERFRALVQTRYDDNYCTAYTTSEKRAVADEILNHIKALNPPGRFLRRTGRAPTSRGLNGPWEELSDREAIKKTCQALRDCNRSDRTGYAAQVQMPDDVRRHAEHRSSTGLTNKQQAAIAAAQKSREVSVAFGSPSGAPPHPSPPPPTPAAPAPASRPTPQQPLQQQQHEQSRATPGQTSRQPGHHHAPTSVARTPEASVLMPYPPTGVPGVVPVPMPVPMPPIMYARPDPNSSQGFSTAPMPLPPPPPPRYHNLLAFPHAHAPPPTQQQQQQQHRQPTPPQTQGQGQQAMGHQVQHHQYIQPFQTQTYQHHQPLRHPGEGTLKRRSSNLDEDKGDSDGSSSGNHSSGWHKKQRTSNASSIGRNGNGHITPDANCGFMSEGLMAGFDMGLAARTPSQETHTTLGTTPTTSAGKSHASNRTSLSSSALPPSPALAYDPHNLLPLASNAAFYVQHDFMSPPTPTHGDHSFAFHQQHHDDNQEANDSPSSGELKQSYHNGNSSLDEHHLQAAAEAAAAAMGMGDAHDDNGYHPPSPGHFSSAEDDDHSLLL